MRFSIPLCICAFAIAAQAADTVLIFTRTNGGREDNIAPARLGLKNYFESKGVLVDTSENAALFTDTGLAKYKAVVFLKTSGDILNPAQQTAFEKYFQAGGGLMAIHSALDTEYNWPFYGILIGGAYFMSLGGDLNTHQNILVVDTNNPATKNLPRVWPRTDEIYNFKANPRDSKSVNVHVLVTVDESTYKGGTPGKDHPMSWYDEYQGGRAWVTAMGHTTASYSDTLFLGHLWGGLQYAMGRPVTALGYSAPAPRAAPMDARKSGKLVRMGPGASANPAAFGPIGSRFGDLKLFQPSGRALSPAANAGKANAGTAEGVELFLIR